MQIIQAGAIAILFRQTNVVWLAFIAASSLLHSRFIDRTLAPYAAVISAFVAFVLHRGSIVVGMHIPARALLDAADPWLSFPQATPIITRQCPTWLSLAIGY